MAEITRNSSKNRMVLMVDSADHITGKTGLTLTLSLSKNGGAFVGLAATVTERGNGWYNVAYTATETDTLGDLVLHASSAGADPTDVHDEVVDSVAQLLDTSDSIEAGLTLRQAVRLMAAVLAGKVSVSGSTVTFRNAVADDKNRIVATDDSFGQRTSIVVDAS